MEKVKESMNSSNIERAEIVWFIRALDRFIFDIDNKGWYYAIIGYFNYIRIDVTVIENKHNVTKIQDKKQMKNKNRMCFMFEIILHELFNTCTYLIDFL